MPQRRWIEYPFTLTNSAFSLPANPSRRGVVISNNSDAGMTFRVGDVATASVGVALEENTAVDMTGDLCPEGLVTVFCAGSGKSGTLYEIVG